MTRPTAHGDAALARLELHTLHGRGDAALVDDAMALELHTLDGRGDGRPGRQRGGADLRAHGDELLHVETLDDDQAHGPR